MNRRRFVAALMVCGVLLCAAGAWVTFGLGVGLITLGALAIGVSLLLGWGVQ